MDRVAARVAGLPSVLDRDDLSRIAGTDRLDLVLQRSPRHLQRSVADPARCLTQSLHRREGEQTWFVDGVPDATGKDRFDALSRDARRDLGGPVTRRRRGRRARGVRADGCCSRRRGQRRGREHRDRGDATHRGDNPPARLPRVGGRRCHACHSTPPVGRIGGGSDRPFTASAPARLSGRLCQRVSPLRSRTLTQNCSG